MASRASRHALFRTITSVTTARNPTDTAMVRIRISRSLPPTSVRPRQDLAHAQQELLRVERLRHVVLGADLEPVDDVLLARAHAQHEDRDAARLRARLERFEDLGPVATRQHHLEDDEVRVALARGAQGGLAVARLLDLVVLLTQQGGDEAARHRVRVDEQDVRPLHSRTRSMRPLRRAGKPGAVASASLVRRCQASRRTRSPRSKPRRAAPPATGVSGGATAAVSWLFGSYCWRPKVPSMLHVMCPRATASAMATVTVSES